jgi:hypothetical protein
MLKKKKKRKEKNHSSKVGADGVSVQDRIYS